jgi:RHS repeat-associated protein
MNKILLTTFGAVAVLTATVGAYDTSCGNPWDNDSGDGNCKDDSKVGTNPINAQRACLIRRVTDIQTYGAAPIEFTRIYNSRTRDYTRARWELGTQYTWQHNWQYEMRESGTSNFGFPQIIVRYPQGKEIYFQAVDSTGAVRVPPADCGDRLYPTGAGTFTLRTPEGKEYDFRKVTVTGGYQYLLDQVRNGTGWRWTLTYQQQSDGLWRLYRITNNYGRYLQLARTPSANSYWRITSVTASDGRAVNFGYSTWTPTSETVLTSVNYPGTEQASYTWCGATTETSGPPLLATATDPLYAGSGSRMKYVYNYTAAYFGGSPFGIVNGTVLEERNLVTDKVVVSFPLGSGSYPKILEGNGTEITRKFENGLLKESADGEGRVTTFTYSAAGTGYLISRTAPGGAVTAFGRDFAGRLLTQTNALGGVSQRTYNASGFLLTSTDELNRTTTHTRDANNRITRTDHPDGTYETFTYTGTGLLKTHRLRNGATETFNYDSLGNLTSHIDAAGNTASYTYATSGLHSSMTDRRGLVSNYQFNWRGLPTRITHPDGSYQEMTYDNLGLKVSERNEIGNIWTFSYTEYNQLATRTDPLNRTTTYEYGRAPGCGTCGYLPTLARITLPSGKKVENTYDLSGKLISRTVGAGTAATATTQWTYGADGEVATQVDPRGKVTAYTRDLLRRKTAETDPLGHTTSWAYDAVGNVLTTTFADATTATGTYDAMNRPLTSTDALGQTTTFTYHPDGSLASLTDARASAYTFVVDALSRRTRMNYPGGSYETWTYDGNSNMTQYRTRAGVTMSCTFDNRNRDTFCDWSDSTPDVTKTYDAAGRMLSLSNSVAASAFTYDAANQVLGESITISGLTGAKTVAYTYDADGNRASLTDPSGSVITYSYTGRNQVEAIVADGPPPLASFTYDTAGNRTSRSLESGIITSTYTYDDDGRLMSLAHGSLETLTYTYDAMNRRTGETRSSAPARTFGYDLTGQLTAVNQSSGNATFAYDAVGNRTVVTGAPGAGNYTANNLNQYTTGGGVGALTYDANGNLATSGGWTYTHNGNSRLVGVSGPGSVAATFGRDGRNRDVKRTINGTTTYLIYDGWNLVAEYDAAGVPTTRYIHGPQVDEILAKVTTTSTTFPLPDALGSTIAVTDASGAVLERVYYSDAFGTPTFKDASGTTLAGTSTGTRFLFTGREWLAALSLYDYRNRTYSAELGRFLQTDPIGFSAGDVNLYRYVANDPVNSVDPSGEVAVLAPAVGFIIAQLTSQLGHLISGFAQDAMSLCGKAACFEDCMSCCDRLFAVAAASKAAAVATGQASCFALIHPGAVGACLGLVTAEAISASVKLSEAGAACSASCKGKPKRKE